jgi:hypothetical protein
MHEQLPTRSLNVVRMLRFGCTPAALALACSKMTQGAAEWRSTASHAAKDVDARDERAHHRAVRVSAP